MWNEPVPSPAPQNWVVEIAFTTDDADGLRKYLMAHGMSAGALSNEGGAPRFDVLDPEGNHIAFVQRAAKAEDFKSSAKQLGNRMIHAGYVVKDRAAEDRFYRDILGFRTYWYGGFKDENIDWFEF